MEKQSWHSSWSLSLYKVTNAKLGMGSEAYDSNTREAEAKGL